MGSAVSLRRSIAEMMGKGLTLVGVWNTRYINKLPPAISEGEYKLS